MVALSRAWLPRKGIAYAAGDLIDRPYNLWMAVQELSAAGDGMGAAEDLLEAGGDFRWQGRAGEGSEVGVEVLWVARAGEYDVGARFVAAETVGGIGDAGRGAALDQEAERIFAINFLRVNFAAFDQALQWLTLVSRVG